MIPHQITLTNFLSYRQTFLSFEGLQTACICGPNGSGKSSLLEAITWVLWGESRANSEDDVIHTGATEARVDFQFFSQGQRCRVIRSRVRGSTSILDFQISETEPDSPADFRPLTERNLRATQQAICNHLRMDYETFINSAYLRQGRADEFTLKRPAERKQILAEILGLGPYDELAERARERARQFRAQASVLEDTLRLQAQQVQQRERVDAELKTLQTQCLAAQHQQQIDRQHLTQLQQQQHQRQSWEQRLGWVISQQQSRHQDSLRLQSNLAQQQQQLQRLTVLLADEVAIMQGYSHCQSLQVQEANYNTKLQQQQQLGDSLDHYSRQLERCRSELLGELQAETTRLEALVLQQQETQALLHKAPEIETAVRQLQTARDQLSHLDQLQTKAAPLLQRRAQLQVQLNTTAARLSARLDELDTRIEQLRWAGQHQEKLQTAVGQVQARVHHLEKRRIYQQRVQEKGLERRSFLERLQGDQRAIELQLAQLDGKLSLLKVPDASCPVCERPLDEPHWNLVGQKHQQQQQELLGQLWVIREQLAVSEREIQVLRREYRELEQELTALPLCMEEKGRLQEQLEASQVCTERLAQLETERQQLAQKLQQGAHSAEICQELTLLDQTLDGLNYDERTHALIRGQVDRWRWAEGKQTELKAQRRKLTDLESRLPNLQARVAVLQARLDQEQVDSTLQAQIAQLKQQMAELGYDREQHQQIRERMRLAQDWLLRYQELMQARQQLPLLQQQLAQNEQALAELEQELQALATQQQDLSRQLEQTPDATEKIQTLEQAIEQRRFCLERDLSRLGQVQQQQQHLVTQAELLEQQRQTLTTAQKQQQIYQELSNAFGRNGIQALMIENVLPQLEAEANSILARLSASQFHIRFVTQRSSKRKSDNSKLIETLDIVIADAQGTRPYETYSGGEAFRINFAIRLALSKLLAQRAGTALQTLIIDEGFGTQDAEGCERLVAAINTISPDFACILVITHMPLLKEAFETRIEVSKMPEGSHLSLVV
ncbi:AAA family ATPase [Leptolyngbya sp. FACHB-261]|uniref:AAA family ATPase n=1 Tax=Leptolyngbya sp. FACHB-261 TaxID=2692806 RepID=UPI0016851354|nr:SMC family ATPase [Leptolyngbya sp. FACHB-261]MBD2101527.1 SMC family ATPase [Leptolyngbya sp. FACHB-261]